MLNLCSTYSYLVQWTNRMFNPYWQISGVFSEVVLLENSSNFQLENSGVSHRPFYWKTHPDQMLHIIYGFSQKNRMNEFSSETFFVRPRIEKKLNRYSWFLVDEFSSIMAGVTTQNWNFEKMDEFSSKTTFVTTRKMKISGLVFQDLPIRVKINCQFSFNNFLAVWDFFQLGIRRAFIGRIERAPLKVMRTIWECTTESERGHMIVHYGNLAIKEWNHQGLSVSSWDFYDWDVCAWPPRADFVHLSGRPLLNILNGSSSQSVNLSQMVCIPPSSSVEAWFVPEI